MGVWGSGLYSGDFALDLRSTIRAVSRLPFEPEKLLEILCLSQLTAANNPDDEDHTTFWLVVADQFARRSVLCERARDQALAIISSGSDIALHKKLGLNPAGLRQRSKVLEEVRERITAPLSASGPRPVLKKPQPLLMGVGDVFVYPTLGGRCRNPYAASTEQDREGTATPAWRPDSWAAMVIVDCDRAFEFLSWYRPLTISTAMTEKPEPQTLRGELLWKLGSPGTCSAVHFKRMGLEKIACVAVDGEKLRHCFPQMRPGIRQAVDDISIANTLNVGPYVPAVLMPRPGEAPNFSRGRPFPTLLGIEQILTD
jgi:hypothetical protein